MSINVPEVNLKLQKSSAMLSSGARILIVDGQVSVARLVAKIFGMSGLANTDVAFDTLTARNQIEADPPDIVVIDARIGPMLMTAFISLIRRLTDGHAIILIMVTSNRSIVIESALEAGVSDYLIKPFTAVDLTSKLIACLKTKKTSK